MAKLMGNPRNSGEARTDIWLTPPFIFRALGEFDLDPCAPPAQPWPTARRTYTKEDDGLTLPWEGRVWLNPPYSQGLMAAFMRLMAQHNHGTALIFAKTETRMFFEHVWSHASALLFIKARLHFYEPTGEMAPYNSGAPSVLVAYGAQDMDVLSTEPVEGKFVALRLPTSWLVSWRDRSWREAVQEFFAGRETVSLGELYEAFADNPKAQANPNYRAKLRQTLQRARYRNVGPGVWARNLNDPR